MKIGVALNPAAGKGRSEKYQQVLRNVLAMYPVNTKWLPVGSPDESMRTMRNHIRDGLIDALVVVGGDGFIHTTVNAVGDSHIPVGIIAAGSGNDIAREFDLPIHSVHDSMHQIVSSLLSGRYRHVDVMEIEWAGGVERALAIVSVGIDAEANNLANRHAWPKGNLRYVRGVIGALRSYKPYGVRLTMDGHSHAGPMMLLSIANTRFFGGGFCISPQALPDDGLLDVVVTPSFRALDLVELIPKLLLLKHTKDPNVHVLRTNEILVEPAPEYGAELPVMMADGEEICRAPATIRIVPQTLKLVM
ncbi:diacylglycerol kinase (ATP) [Trueperella bonasi]|uniref:Diacylglycerol kinase (ATP) n=1 Tax=Trueperella bonasi TaxID=312286 RepID=A0ABT9NDJ6_9ACTO|nr:diacylglycerol kinase family protein [Trueperella bonasi]MDP9805462.1 diacylglycerol kinase (ATP) [Trueperella bonasi]